MALKPITRCPGLYTNPNDIGEIPEGALVQADNVVISRDGIVEPRRGLPFFGASGLARIMPYAATGKLLGIGSSGQVYSDATNGGSGTTAYVNPVSSSFGAKSRWAEQNGRLYVTTGANPPGTNGVNPGVLRYDGAPSNNTAGVNRGLDVQLSLVAGSILAPTYQVGYRVVWGIIAANGDLVLGPPSGLATIQNTGASAQNVQVVTTAPYLQAQSGETIVLQIYRTASSASAPLDEPALVYQQTWNPGSVPATVTYSDSVSDALLGAALYTNPSQLGIAAANYPPPAALDISVFRRSMFYANVITLPRLSLHLLAVGTGGLQVGDFITFQLTAYPSGTTKSVTVAAAATENIGLAQFAVVTSGSPQANVAATTDSLIRVLNRCVWTNWAAGQGPPMASYLLSGPNDPAGIIGCEPSITGYDLVFICTRAGAFLEGTGATKTWISGAQQNAIYYSQTDQPEGVPLTNYVKVGSASHPVLRVIPLRDSHVVIKTDGIWRITGDGPANFRVDPLDLTVEVLVSESAAALENTVVALSNQGVVRISDTGVTVISRPVENLILPLVAPSMLATSQSLGYGIAYESGRKYILYLPTLSIDTAATQAFVYDLFTDTWTRWPNPRTLHGLVNPADDRLYVVDQSTLLRQERKNYDATDYGDEAYSATVSAVTGTSITLSAGAANIGDRIAPSSTPVSPGFGALVIAVNGSTYTLDRNYPGGTGVAIVYRAIPVAVEWECQTHRESGPGSLGHWREITLFFRALFFAQASATFSTEIVPTQATEPLTGSNYLMTDPPPATQPATLLRVVVPRQHQRSARLAVSFAMTQAMSQMQLQGFQTAGEPGRERVGR